MKRRGNGEGSIYKNEKLNMWTGQYTKPNGKRGAVYGKTRQEVKEKLVKVLAEIQTHSYIETSSITLIEITRSIVEDRYNSNKTRDNAYRTNLDTIKRIEKSNIAKMKIQKITEEHLKDYLNSLTSKYSNSSIRKVYGLLNATFRRAVAKGYIVRNPFDNKEEMQRPQSKKKDKKVKALTLEEQQKLEVALKEYSDTTYKNIIRLALYTGMRSGEILALKISDIDLRNKVIHIQRTLTKDINAKTIIGEDTKTEDSVRDIVIDEVIEKILKDSIRLFQFNENNLLFLRNGKLITNSQVNIAFKKLCKQNDINAGYNVNFHMLRHTFATRCIESGMPAEVVQKKLGHHDVEITINTYTDIFNKYESEHTNNYLNYLRENKVLLQ